MFKGETSMRFGKGPFGPPPTVEHFSTSFVRPDAFRFEFRAPGAGQMTFVVWKQAELEKAAVPNRIVERELDELLFTVAPISHGSALTVPALLMSERFHGKGLFASLGSVRLRGEEKVDGRRAFRIDAVLREDQFSIWI